VLRSMTGFGRGEYEAAGLQATVEIRSVNHRFSEIMVRIPRQYFLLEEKIKNQVQKDIARGHLDIYINIKDGREKKRNVKLDKELAVAYYNCLREMANFLNIDFELDLDDLAQLPDVLIVEEKETDLDDVWMVVEKALSEGMTHLLEMRDREGTILYKDFITRRSRIAGLLDEIKVRIPSLVEELHSRLKSRLQILLDDAEIDEARLATEVVLFAERSNITEEVVRLSSHLEQLEEILQAKGSVGRKIEFLLQEMNREINTIGSKAADLTISPLVVEIKSELEKMREQVQNIE
jgi:uncharacterized protein (TIGR00255 family)